MAGNGPSLERCHGEPQGRFQERHFAPAEVAEMWNLSPDVVRKLFEREPGVLVIGDPVPRGKRRYTTLRIPESVAERVHRRLCNPAVAGGRLGRHETWPLGEPHAHRT